MIFGVRVHSGGRLRGRKSVFLLYCGMYCVVAEVVGMGRRY